MSLQKLLERSAEQYVKNVACEFLDGQQSFATVTQMLSKFGYRKQQAARLLLPLRNHGDGYRAEALFRWIELREW
ncbi:MAG: hypothetical protein HYX72_09730 [Acidobacteria bacterium]|nr:hypothetical protein [Acidobacteriota bacterium]